MQSLKDECSSCCNKVNWWRCKKKKNPINPGYKNWLEAIAPQMCKYAPIFYRSIS